LVANTVVMLCQKAGVNSAAASFTGGESNALYVSLAE
jgi:hypothetical protein